ncbi:MAG: DUF3108 domain-containing protein [Burkholderiales bacterium]|nr:DUF3108 domain-containing protein [Burkholderiales bacterium]
MKMIRLALLALAAVGFSAHAAGIPTRVEMDVSVEAKGFTVGAGRDTFEHDGKTYTVNTEARTVGIARALKKMDEKRESRGLITERGLRPLSFKQSRTGKAPNAASFDWEKGELTMDEGGDIEKVPLTAGTLDQATLAYAFLFTEPPKSETFKVNVTDGRKLQEYELALVGREKIETDLGELDTLHFRKVQKGDDKRGFEFWLALDHHRLPVRIRIVEKDGTAFDSTVTKITYPGK